MIQLNCMSKTKADTESSQTSEIFPEEDEPGGSLSLFKSSDQNDKKYSPFRKAMGKLYRFSF